MPPRLTATRLELLRRIAQHVQEHGRPPSAAELARLMGQSEAGISIHLKALISLGLIERLAARGPVHLTSKAEAILQVGIPIYGQIAAGPPLLAEQTTDRFTPSLDKLMGVKEGDFLLEVRGESMTGIGIMDGDLVLVRPAQEVLDGEVAVVLIPGENTATLKRVYRMHGEILLENENPNLPRLPAYPAEQVTIQGKMIGRLGLGTPPRKSRRR